MTTLTPLSESSSFLWVKKDNNNSLDEFEFSPDPIIDN